MVREKTSSCDVSLEKADVKGSAAFPRSSDITHHEEKVSTLERTHVHLRMRYSVVSGLSCHFLALVNPSVLRIKMIVQTKIA